MQISEKKIIIFFKSMKKKLKNHSSQETGENNEPQFRTNIIYSEKSFEEKKRWPNFFFGFESI